jgi:excisionase family DNA binding protein
VPEQATTLGLRAAAEQLGVHYMTAYRYVRSGRLPAHKSGSEWQVDPADLAALAAAPPPSRGRSGAPRAVHRDRLERRLIAGDEAGAWSVVEAALGSGAEPSEVLTELLAPSLRSIGQRWADGELTIADEHRASAVAQRLIARMGPRFARPGRRRGVVVLGSVAGDRHSLPTAILGDLLRGAGLEVVDLGADCPTESFVDAVHRADTPAAVGICVTAPEALDAVPGVVEGLRDGGVRCPVVVGGGAVADGDVARRLGADCWAGPIDEVVELFVSLAGVPAAAAASSDSTEAAE